MLIKAAQLMCFLTGADTTDAGVELVLNGGQRLRITKGVDEETLRTVLAALEPAGC